jgi:tetratricopeptide (TPR) repeat protein
MARSDKDLQVRDYRGQSPALRPSNRTSTANLDTIEHAARLFSHAKLLKNRGKGIEAVHCLAEVIERLSGETSARGLTILMQALEVLGTVQNERGDPAATLKCGKSAEMIRQDLLALVGSSAVLVETGISLTHLMVRAWLDLGELDKASHQLSCSSREVAVLMARSDGTPAWTDLAASQLRLEIAINAADPERAVELGEQLLSLRRESLCKYGRSRSQLERLADAVSWQADCLLVANFVTQSAVLYEEAIKLRTSLVTISCSDDRSLIALSSALVAAAQFNLYLGDQPEAERLALDASEALTQVQPDHLDFPNSYFAFTETCTELAAILAQGGDQGCFEAKRLLLAAVETVDQLLTKKADETEIE